MTRILDANFDKIKETIHEIYESKYEPDKIIVYHGYLVRDFKEVEQQVRELEKELNYAKETIASREKWIGDLQKKISLATQARHKAEEELKTYTDEDNELVEKLQAENERLQAQLKESVEIIENSCPHLCWCCPSSVADTTKECEKCTNDYDDEKIPQRRRQLLDSIKGEK